MGWDGSGSGRRCPPARRRDRRRRESPREGRSGGAAGGRPEGTGRRRGRKGVGGPPGGEQPDGRGIDRRPRRAPAPAAPAPAGRPAAKNRAEAGRPLPGAIGQGGDARGKAVGGGDFALVRRAAGRGGESFPGSRGFHEPSSLRSSARNFWSFRRARKARTLISVWLQPVTALISAMLFCSKSSIWITIRSSGFS